MNIWLEIILPAICSMLISLALYPIVRYLAMKFKVVDNPNERRLNKKPIPSMGGVGIFIASIFVIACTLLIFDLPFHINILVTLSALLIVGVLDDQRNIRWTLKLLIELLIFWSLMRYSGLLINDFNGLWGIETLPVWFIWIFTFFFFVGITNGVNLMDGINGLASGYGIMSLIFMGLYFVKYDVAEFAMSSFVVIGAIIPFWFFNVFSRNFKMFLGDGGSLVLGLALAIFAIEILKIETFDSGIISYVLAILSVPIFDTLRVMMVRVFKGRSPMSPDKSHLHHILIDLGFPHLLATMTIIALGGLVILSWWLCEWYQTGIDTQFYIVFGLGVLVTSGIYYPLSCVRRFNPRRWQRWQESLKSKAVA